MNNTTIVSFNFQIDRTQYDYRLWYERVLLQVITGVEFNCKAATQGATSCYRSHLINAAA